MTFEEDLAGSFQNLRRVLHGLLEGAGLDPREPQEVARQLAISRNLTWKISKVLGTADLYEAVQHLPGGEGLEILLVAMQKRVGQAAPVDAVRAAQRDLERVIEVHAGDRATFDLILDGLTGQGSESRLEVSRKLAFRGNSGLWGAQARARVTVSVVAPSSNNPDLVDRVLIGGIVDFRRLRPNMPWPLFHARSYHADGSPLAPSQAERAIDPAHEATEGPKLLGKFCSPNLPPIRVVRSQAGSIYELGEGPVGNKGSCTCFFGTWAANAAPRYGTDDDPYHEVFSQIAQPAELLHFDVLVHKDMCEGHTPSVHVMGRSGWQTDATPVFPIPVSDRLVELVGLPGALASADLPRQAEMLAYTMERMSWDVRQFRAFRLRMPFPPMHTTVVVRMPAPRRASNGRGPSA